MDRFLNCLFAFNLSLIWDDVLWGGLHRGTIHHIEIELEGGC